MNPEPLPPLFRIEYLPKGIPNRRWIIMKTNPWSHNSWTGAGAFRTEAAAKKALAKLKAEA